MKHPIPAAKALGLSIAICLGLGSLSGLAVRGRNLTWYAQLAKPTFTPPSFLFGPVWTVLYVLMGIALALIWQRREGNQALLLLFAVQLLLNLAWSPIFFYYQRIGLALITLILLLLSIIACIALAWRHKDITLLLAPYLLWVSFAGILNASIFILNF